MKAHSKSNYTLYAVVRGQERCITTAGRNVRQAKYIAKCWWGFPKGLRFTKVERLTPDAGHA